MCMYKIKIFDLNFAFKWTILKAVKYTKQIHIEEWPVVWSRNDKNAFLHLLPTDNFLV